MSINLVKENLFTTRTRYTQGTQGIGYILLFRGQSHLFIMDTAFNPSAWLRAQPYKAHILTYKPLSRCYAGKGAKRFTKSVAVSAFSEVLQRLYGTKILAAKAAPGRRYLSYFLND
ncbi:hypothetical protein NPIL_684051 [Nephila pilipes]|uniref:Uncharacterized protein n=1 Tax=Nephila pilipes TaxID=299642 RepID=A0A8X6Q1Q3_NEPPI|nr:hypothetical protein NPIL_684051 [Nephila pilipes]